MPRNQQAPTTNAAIFNIKLSLPLMELETSSVMVPVSIGISPLLILSTMVNACSIASVMITMRAIRAESIKIEPRRYFFKTRCPRPGNIRPDRSAAFIDLLISSALAYGRLPERLLSARNVRSPIRYVAVSRFQFGFVFRCPNSCTSENVDEAIVLLVAGELKQSRRVHHGQRDLYAPRYLPRHRICHRSLV